MVQGGARGLLRTCLALVKNQGRELALPSTAPALHNMMSLPAGQVGFSVEEGAVWWAEGVEDLNRVLKGAGSAGV